MCPADRCLWLPLCGCRSSGDAPSYLLAFLSICGGCHQGDGLTVFVLNVFQMDVDEETAEKFYQKLLELEKETLEKYSDLLD